MSLPPGSGPRSCVALLLASVSFHSAWAQTPQPGGPHSFQSRGQSQAVKTCTTASNERNIEGTATSHLSIAPEQRRRIKPLVAANALPASDRGLFGVQIGVVVPRQVKLVPLPREASTILRAYQGCDYVRVGDTLLLVEPDGRHIVANVPTSGD